MNLKPEDVTLYAVCMKDKPLRFNSRAKIISFLGDEGDNADVNPYWAELSCMYSLWNNCNSSFFGIINYRRNWEERSLLSVEDDTLYIPSGRAMPAAFAARSEPRRSASISGQKS